MNALVNNSSPFSDVQLKSRLIRSCGLTIESITKIRNVENTLGLSFDEAALGLGLVTQEEINAARSPERRLSSVTGRNPTPGGRLPYTRDPTGAHSENIRALRTELLLRSNNGGQANVIALLSPSPGEGRSQMAAELAISFAQLGQPTLLVDADLRHSIQHKLFDADNQSGLSNTLSQDVPANCQAVLDMPHLHLLTAGSAQRNPLELLSDGRFEQIVREWRRTYSFIVIDTSPVNNYSDGLAIAKLIGRVLILSRAHHTRHRDTKTFLRKLSATRSEILGAVVNNF